MDIELAQALAENELLKSMLYCTKRSCNNCGDDYFALWLVSKKLEAKGFKCELEKGEFTFSGIFYYDRLIIEWE